MRRVVFYSLFFTSLFASLEASLQFLLRSSLWIIILVVVAGSFFIFVVALFTSLLD